MKYSESNFPNKEQLRSVILDLYSRDIAESSVHFSSRNYAFCFSQGCFPAAIRVGLGGKKTRSSVMSELMFVDYIKLTVPTVSEPIVSKNNSIVEETDINGEHYCITMFRKANGDVLPEKYWNNQYYEMVGSVLGKIHHASYEAGQQGFKFKRPKWYDTLPSDFNVFEKALGKDVCAISNNVINKIKALPETPQTFGIIHGDFGLSNIFTEWDNVWVFDFDDCCYGHYITDVTFALYSMIGSPNYVPPHSHEEDRFGSDGIYAHFRKGYERFFSLPDEQWNLIEDFCMLRNVEVITMMQDANFPAEITQAYLSPLIAALKTSESIFKFMDRKER